MSETKSLGDTLPDDIKRVTEMLSHYVELGPGGTFAAMMIRADDVNACGVISVVVAPAWKMLMRYGLCRFGVGKLVFRGLCRSL